MKPPVGREKPFRFEPADERRLGLLRNALLTLHRVLLDGAREQYERTHGRVEGHLEMFRLVRDEPAFAWLRSVSDLVVRLDETLDAPVAGIAEEIVTTAEVLFLNHQPEDPTFQLKYLQALQERPDVVLAHAEVARTIRTLAKERFVLVSSAGGASER
ncbi:MAG: hypothetical protein U0527_01570 [Candidatus Eisenbacteria bacterium]